jgi:hypothetical protein
VRGDGRARQEPGELGTETKEMGVKCLWEGEGQGEGEGEHRKGKGKVRGQWRAAERKDLGSCHPQWKEMGVKC